MARLISSTRTYMSHLKEGDKFRFIDGKYFYTVSSIKNGVVYCKHRAHPESEFSFNPRFLVVLKCKPEQTNLRDKKYNTGNCQRNIDHCIYLLALYRC